MKIVEQIKRLFGVEKIDYSAILENGGVLIDVRTPTEFNSGNALGSRNIPLTSLSQYADNLKGKQVVLVCRSGARAATAKNELTKLGITAFNAGSWKNIN